jgi:molybdopterin molybdotransferase
VSSIIRNAPSCADDRESGVLSVEAARTYLLTQVIPLDGIERLPLRSALDRILAEDIISPIDVPGHTNSAMDGFALRYVDLDPDGRTELRCIGTAMAGQPFAEVVGAGECVRIMTGAPLPEGADTVVMQEHADDHGAGVTIGGGERQGQNIRLAGEDLARGSSALEKGKRITAADLGLIASLGQAEVSVVRRPRVAFFSTGDELRALGEPLREGDVYDSNRYTLFGMLTRAGAELRDLGVVPDDPAELRHAFGEAAAHADMVITSGGVSVGDADYTKQVLAELGDVAFWKIAMKPGRPLTFGRLGNAWFFGLPGNPVAVMVTFYQFVLPVLHRFAGETDWQPLTQQARLREPLRKRLGRSEFVRGILSRDADGGTWVSSTGAQGSGILRSMSVGNCFIILDEETGSLAEGEPVLVQPFAAFM